MLLANMRKVSYKTITVSETPVTVPVSFTETVTYTKLKEIIKTAPPQPPVTIPYVTTEEITKVITETLVQTPSPYPPVTYTKVKVITEQLPPIKIYKTQPAVTLPGETKEYTETVTEKKGYGTPTTIYPPVGTTISTYTYPSLTPEYPTTYTPKPPTTTYTQKPTSLETSYIHPTPSSSSSTTVTEAPTRSVTATGTVFPPEPTSSLLEFPGAAPATNAQTGVAAIIGMVVFLVLA